MSCDGLPEADTSNSHLQQQTAATAARHMDALLGGKKTLQQ
jgi:hypothetical protein